MVSEKDKEINRRDFLFSTAAAGAGLVLAPGGAARAAGGGKVDDIHVAILGCGAQGQVLLDACMNMGPDSGIRFKAVCDIWKEYNQGNVSRRLSKTYKQENNAYEDYREMLEKEKDLDAVIIATPDFCHAEHACACMEAGLHVYCEKEMSNTLEGAKRMVETAKRTGKLLQIGHQRRSNPRYIHCYEKLILEAQLLGRITTAEGQWNRAAKEDLLWPKKFTMDEATLQKYGFKSMEQFRNWRWYKGLGGGPIVDLGSHQIDIFSWFLQANPSAVIASGGTDYYEKATHEWYDTVMAIYEYQTARGTVRALYKTLTTNGYGGYYEVFMGDEGALDISESANRGNVYASPTKVSAGAWDKWVKLGFLSSPAKPKETETKDAVMDVRETGAPASYSIPVEMKKKYHQPHLENFFNAIRGKEKLNCPAEVGYETAVTVLKVNDAVEANRRLEFKPQDFQV